MIRLSITTLMVVILTITGFSQNESFTVKIVESKSSGMVENTYIITESNIDIKKLDAEKMKKSKHAQEWTAEEKEKIVAAFGNIKR